MKSKKISTKIKTIGIIFFLLMLSIILTTIYLNQKNKKDATTINIASTQSMLTQKISKDIFYNYMNKNLGFVELNEDVKHFSKNLNLLKNGDKYIGIIKVPTPEIEKQLAKVESLWQEFLSYIIAYQKNASNNKIQTKKSIDNIQNSNLELLQEADILVNFYIDYSEKKIDYIKKFQYLSAIALLVLIFYGFTQFRRIETHAQEFLNFSKQMIENPDNIHLKTLNINAESEINEATDTLNMFINKVNTAMDYSAVAIEQSKNASSKLEEITDEFDKVLDELKDSTDVTQHLDKSEDMVIESTEELINSTKKLQKLKDELDKLVNSLTP